MPVALLKHHFLRRDKANRNPKAHAHAAYLSGTKLDDGFGRTADFTPKGGILHAELWTPKEAPSWAKDRGELWRQLEKRENNTTRHAGALLAHKFIGALPHELTLEDNIGLVRDFVREQFTRRGYAADWAIHAPDPGGDSRNYHVHIMVPLRRFENGDWAKTKDRFPKNSPALSQFIKEKQTAFFNLQNRYLQKNNIPSHIRRINNKWTVVMEPAPPEFLAHRGVIYSRPEPRTEAAGVLGKFSTMLQNITLQPPNAQSILLKDLAALSESKPKALPDAPAVTGTTRLPNSYAQLNKTPPPNVETKGWPPEAILDWETKGKYQPVEFFKRWPELSAGNPSTTGGHSP